MRNGGFTYKQLSEQTEQQLGGWPLRLVQRRQQVVHEVLEQRSVVLLTFGGASVNNDQVDIEQFKR